MIDSKKQEIKNLINEIEQNLEKLDEVDFDEAVKAYNKIKEETGYYDAIKNIDDAQVNPTTLLYFDTIYAAFMGFNDRICSTYNLQTGVLKTA